LADKVQDLARQINALPAGEKRRLFSILGFLGDLPEDFDDSSLQSPRLETLSPDFQPIPGPDYVLVFDGGSKGNPGFGYGSYAITRVQDGAQRLERLTFGERYTNNEAEYDSLIAALEDLLETIQNAGRQPQEFSLEIQGDSALVLKQLQGKWQVKDTRMKHRRDQCLRLLRRFGQIEFKAQPRATIVRVLGH
jgi:ribonuclease HI